MEGVDWDDDVHLGMGVVDDNGHEWVMIQDDGPYISLIGLDLNPVGAKREELTPNGKRYELREVGSDEPGHPEVLTTVEDYENAPEGTIVSGYSRSVSYKINHRRWEESGLLGQFTGDEMAGHARDVLRWGPGDEA